MVDLLAGIKALLAQAEAPEEEPPVEPPSDDKDAEIAELKAELEGLQADPRDAEIAELRQKLEEAKGAAGDDSKPAPRPTSRETIRRPATTGSPRPDIGRMSVEERARYYREVVAPADAKGHDVLAGR